jgi:oleate hydratase
MEAVYTLLNVDRGVPEVFDSVYDIRELLKATYYLNDKKPIDQMDLRLPKIAVKGAMKKVQGTWLEELLKEAKLLE